MLRPEVTAENRFNPADMHQIGLSNISIWILDIAIKGFVYAVNCSHLRQDIS